MMRKHRVPDQHALAFTSFSPFSFLTRSLITTQINEPYVFYFFVDVNFEAALAVAKGYGG